MLTIQSWRHTCSQLLFCLGGLIIELWTNYSGCKENKVANCLGQNSVHEAWESSLSREQKRGLSERRKTPENLGSGGIAWAWRITHDFTWLSGKVWCLGNGSHSAHKGTLGGVLTMLDRLHFVLGAKRGHLKVSTSQGFVLNAWRW